MCLLKSEPRISVVGRLYSLCLYFAAAKLPEDWEEREDLVVPSSGESVVGQRSVIALWLQ